MARYTGPKSKKSRSFGEAIYGNDKSFERRKYPPGQHGASRKRKNKSGYALQLMEKQKAKYTYGVLERQFRNLFVKATGRKGVTGEILIQLLESRLDNVVFRLGIAPTRRAARQLVTHRHITLNGIITNIPSCSLKPGDIISIKGKSIGMIAIQDSLNSKNQVRKFPWMEWDDDKKSGIFLEVPTREQIPENIDEHLIVELYSK